MKNKLDTGLDLRNIHYHKKNGYYYLEKTINGKRYYEGCYRDLDKAVHRRDYLDRYGWDNTHRVKNGEDDKRWIGVKKRVARMYGISVEELP